MKIALVLLNQAVAEINKGWVSLFGRMAYAPTTLTQLAALVPAQLNAYVELIDEGVSFFNPETIKADLVGISVLTTNAKRAYGAADILMKKGITVVFGGWHPTLMPAEAAEHANAIVIGYAEKSWPQLLLDFASNNLKKIYNEKANEIFKDSLPLPRYDLLKKRKYMLPYTIEATRGCTNKCAFCVISGCKNYSGFQTRNIDLVISQIKETNAKHITFLDSSPTENIEFCRQLYKSLIPLKIKWSSSITLKVAEDDNWLELAARSGCNGVLIGFESLNQKSLTSGNKNFNQVKRFKEAIKKLHYYNISVFSCFVFGFENDKPDIFERTVDFINDSEIDILNYFILTPYPQTALYEQLNSEKRIIDYRWENYNGTKVVFQPKNMTPDELQKGFEWANLKSYTIRSIAKRLLPPRSNFARNFAGNVFFSIYNNLRF